MIDYNLTLEKIKNFCLKTGCKFVVVSGNGGSGKSTFAKNLKALFEESGFVANTIDTDDFVINTQVRKSSKVSIVDDVGNEFATNYNTSFMESYCVSYFNTLVKNVEEGIDCYYKSKKDREEYEFSFLSGKADVTIIEGVGTQFFNKIKNALYVYINCDVKLEAKRRIERNRNGEDKQTFEQVLEACKNRRINLKEYKIDMNKLFDLRLTSLENFDFKIDNDTFNVLGDIMNKDCDFIISLIKQASNMLVNNFDIIDKGDNGDVVTSIELNIEKFLTKKVKEKYPKHAVISEEFHETDKLTDNCVIINGIDGSVNVAKQMPLFGIQIAVVTGGQNVASVVYLPLLNELYCCDEQNSYLNGKLLKVKSCELNKGLISATGTKRIEKIVALQKYGLILRDYGSIAVSFAWVASSKLNGAIYAGDKIWNYYPVLKICEKAGAKIIDKKGEHIAATDDEFLKLLSK